MISSTARFMTFFACGTVGIAPASYLSSNAHPGSCCTNQDILHDRALIATVSGVHLEREAGVCMSRETGERCCGQLEVGGEHGRERVPQRVPGEAVFEVVKAGGF